LLKETYGHINIALCGGIATTITAAHHFFWRHVYASMQAAPTPTVISITSSKGLMYKQIKRTRFWRRMCNAYAKRMKQ